LNKIKAEKANSSTNIHSIKFELDPAGIISDVFQETEIFHNIGPQLESNAVCPEIS